MSSVTNMSINVCPALRANGLSCNNNTVRSATAPYCGHHKHLFFAAQTTKVLDHHNKETALRAIQEEERLQKLREETEAATLSLKNELQEMRTEMKQTTKQGVAVLTNLQQTVQKQGTMLQGLANCMTVVYQHVRRSPDWKRESIKAIDWKEIREQRHDNIIQAKKEQRLMIQQARRQLTTAK